QSRTYSTSPGASTESSWIRALGRETSRARACCTAKPANNSTGKPRAIGAFLFHELYGLPGVVRDDQPVVGDLPAPVALAPLDVLARDPVEVLGEQPQVDVVPLGHGRDRYAARERP